MEKQIKIIVWSKHNCPFCVRAKHYLTDKKIQFEERIIGEDWTKEQLLEMVPEARSVPQIVVEGKNVGGYNEMIKYFNTLDIPDTFFKRN